MQAHQEVQNEFAEKQPKSVKEREQRLAKSQPSQEENVRVEQKPEESIV